MFKYKKIIAFFIISLLIIGSSIIYIVLADTKGNFKDKTKTVSMQEKAVKNDVYYTEQTVQPNEQIEKVISGYLNSKLNDDMSVMGDYVNDINQINEKKILAQNQYIESYNNIKCTIKKCKESDIYRVYVYYDIKAFEVDSELPSLSAFCVRKYGEDYKIYLGKINADLQKEFDKFDKSDDVTALKQAVQKRMNELISTDEQVRILFDELKAGM